MLTFLGRVPLGVWIGCLVVLLAAATRDGWGFALGAIIIAATIVTTGGWEAREDDEAAAGANEEPDDGTGSERPEG